MEVLLGMIGWLDAFVFLVGVGRIGVFSVGWIFLLFYLLFKSLSIYFWTSISYFDLFF